MPDMKDLHRSVDDRVVYAPAGRATVENAAYRKIERSRFRRRRMRLRHRPEGEDGRADARQPFVRRPRVALLQPQPHRCAVTAGPDERPIDVTGGQSGLKTAPQREQRQHVNAARHPQLACGRGAIQRPTVPHAERARPERSGEPSPRVGPRPARTGRRRTPEDPARFPIVAGDTRQNSADHVSHDSPIGDQPPRRVFSAL